MKLFFKITLNVFVFGLFSFTASTRETILITYAQNKEKAQLVKKILKRDVYLPVELIHLRHQKDPCLIRSSSIVQICVDEKSELRFVRFNQEVVQRSLSIFWEGRI